MSLCSFSMVTTVYTDSSVNKNSKFKKNYLRNIYHVEYIRKLHLKESLKNMRCENTKMFSLHQKLSWCLFSRHTHTLQPTNTQQLSSVRVSSCAALVSTGKWTMVFTKWLCCSTRRLIKMASHYRRWAAVLRDYLHSVKPHSLHYYSALHMDFLWP